MRSFVLITNAKRTSTWKQTRGYGTKNKAEKSASLPFGSGSNECKVGGQRRK